MEKKTGMCCASLGVSAEKRPGSMHPYQICLGQKIQRVSHQKLRHAKGFRNSFEGCQRMIKDLFLTPCNILSNNRSPKWVVLVSAQSLVIWWRPLHVGVVIIAW
ncbi:hypothetical protein TcCL_NonESM11614 [Trypanosoma cruzi]|nr:hypothetical protein TcCL_NonESM11614 [Trypanosoma cruzi]